MGGPDLSGTEADHTLRDDRRGVSAVVGAVLMLALAMLLLSILQAVAIPALNAQLEFQHDQAAQDDVLALESDIDRVAATGIGETAIVDIGLRYPPRLLFINPPPAQGRLRTTAGGEIRIVNATAAGETGDYWTGEPVNLNTTALEYRPGYNEYDDAPTTVLEPWAVYNRFDEAVVSLSETDLVDGRVISLVALDGTYRSQSADSVGVNLVPSSAPVRTVTVSNDTGPIKITVPTQLPREAWADLLADELDPAGSSPDQYITDLQCAGGQSGHCGELTIVLEPGSYDFRLGEVTVGTGETTERAAYLTDISGNGTSVVAGGSEPLVVEARDRFDNPVSGVTVTANVTQGNGTVRAITATTDRDGRAVFRYEAPKNASALGTVTVSASFGEGDEETVTFSFSTVGGVNTNPGADNGTDPGGESTSSADTLSIVPDSVASRNIGGRDRGREVTFSIQMAKSVIVTDILVTTQDDLLGRPYIDRGTTVAGSELPVEISGEVEVALRDIIASSDLGVSEFVAPDDPEADIIIVIEFADGSTRVIGIA